MTTSEYEICYSKTVRGTKYTWGHRADLTEANAIARGLTDAPDIARAQVWRNDKIATEYGRNGELLRYRNDA